MHLLFTIRFLWYYVFILGLTYLIVLFTNFELLQYAESHMILWFVVLIGSAITFHFAELNKRVTKLEASLMVFLLVNQQMNEENKEIDNGTENDK